MPPEISQEISSLFNTVGEPHFVKPNAGTVLGPIETVTVSDADAKLRPVI